MLCNKGMSILGSREVESIKMLGWKKISKGHSRQRRRIYKEAFMIIEEEFKFGVSGE